LRKILRQARDDSIGEINIDRDKNFFTYKFDPTLGSGAKKNVTGQTMIPAGEGSLFPLVLMIRGFVSQEIYQTGIGTSRVAERLSEAGFITLSPDFLGYGGSDSESGNIFETRFQTYTTILGLIADAGQIEEWDGENIFIWAHSNGGQVALTALAVNGEEIPTVLWAPVSKPFPYSILYYADEAADGGKFLRRGLAEFEADYDTDLFSFDKYLSNINANFQIHQGGADDAIPVEWNDELVEDLEKKDLNVEYFVYPQADHNLVPNWGLAVSRTIEFYLNNVVDK